MSDFCLTRVMRAQDKAGLPAGDCPANGMGRMDPPQRFFGFADNRGEGRTVDIVLDLRLMTPDGVPLPILRARMVPGQVHE